MSASDDILADSRRLLGPNWHFAGPGAVLNALPPACHDDKAILAWRENVAFLTDGLGWPSAQTASHKHQSGTILAFAAPLDQLQTACDVNELAWEAAASGMPLDRERVLAACQSESANERELLLTALVQHAQQQALAVAIDDDDLTIGIGAGGRTWPRTALPAVEQIAWNSLRNMPTIVVTGTNGKTTSVRLCARIAAAAGYAVGYNCTEGVVVAGESVVTGDYAGPAGARRVLRHPDVTFAILESARGGILRRGLAVDRAQVALVTNISPDHFGEYGIDRIETLADAKLAVARLVDPDGLLVINADCPVLMERAPLHGKPLGLFALDDHSPALIAHRDQNGATCGVADGRLRLTYRGNTVDLGAIEEMPLTVRGSARYNIANIAASALACAACGIAPTIIASVLSEFGKVRQDNPGRLERWSLDGAEILLDYAHNPDGMAGLLAVAASLQGKGRLGVTMGQAGNRSDTEIRQLAATAARAAPDLILLKDEPGFMRGRRPGEVPELLRAALIDCGMAASKIHIVLDELEAGYSLLAWTRSGDVAVLSVHGNDSRPRLRTTLDLLQRV